MVFRAEREPDAVAVGQAVHAVAGVLTGERSRRCLRAVAAGRSLGKNRRARLCGVAPVGGDNGAVGFAVDDVFGVFKPVPLC